MPSTISHSLEPVHPPEPVMERLLEQAKTGSPSALGPLLAAYGEQLRRIADRQLDEKLRGRVSPSDIVQDALMQATRDIADFRGETDAEFGAWLRRILARRLSKSIEVHVLAEKRDIRRETFFGSRRQTHLPAGPASTSLHASPQQAVADRRPGPFSEVVRKERSELLEATLRALPDRYREVIELRNGQGLSFEQIAVKLNRSSGATRMLWLRAIDAVRKQMSDGESA